jgi:tetratricopeptide (TPR) repeat protein
MQLDEAGDALTRGLELARRQGVRPEEGRALAALGQVAAARGHFGEARSLCDQAQSIFEAEGLREDQAITLNTLGIATRHAGDAAASVDCFRRSLEVQTPGNDETTREATLSHLALALEDQGDHEEALNAGLEALKLNREIGNRRRTGLILGHLSQIYLELGDSEAGYARARQSVRHCRDRRNPLHEGLALVSLARAELERDRVEQARSALLYAEAVAADTQARQLDLELALAQARLALAAGRAEEGLGHAQRGARIAGETGQPGFEALACARGALALSALDRKDEALEQARRGVAVLAHSAPTIEVEVCLSLAEVWPADDKSAEIDAVRERARRSVMDRAKRIRDSKLRASFEARPMHQRALE